MTNKETITRNIGLTFDFVEYLMDNPKAVENLPDKFTLQFVEQDFSKTVKPIVNPKKRKSIVEKFVRVKNTFEISLK